MDLATSIDPHPFTPTGSSEADKGLLVKFYHKTVQDTRASRSEGRPVFREAEYISITPPGTREGVAREASDQDKARFPEHYRAFQQRVELPPEGFPLKEWGLIPQALVEELAFVNIKTVEQLSLASDGLLQGRMGLQTMKQRALAWLERRKEEAPLDRLEAELAERDQQIAQLSAQLAELKASMPKPDLHSDLDEAPADKPEDKPETGANRRVK